MCETKILVTGGAGFIGSATVAALAKEGNQVTVFDNQWRDSGTTRTHKNIEYIEGDVRDAESVSSAMAGCNAIIHMAAINGTRNFYERPGLVLEVGTRGVLNVLDAARTTGCSELYFLQVQKFTTSRP